jgi:hypothetical protein
MDKCEYLSAALQQKICRCNICDLRIQEIGSVAVVKSHLTGEFKLQKHAIRDDLLVTDVWLSTDDGWRAITRHASHLPEAKSSATT